MAVILVVDDIADNVRLLQYDLEDDDHRVLTATNGEEALVVLDRNDVDLVLMDVNMPVLDGIGTLRRMRGVARTSDIPVIMVTANDMDEKVIEALDVGADDYVVKPFSYAVLAARMRSLLRLRTAQARLKEVNRELERLASTDTLTEVHNRRSFTNLARAEINRAQRKQLPLAMVMMDIDHFKAINDRYGHDVGDTVLKQFANLARMAFREHDVFGRTGGEEFAVCMPDTSPFDASAAVMRFREQLQSHPVVLENGTAIPVRFSAGLSCLGTDGHALDDLLKAADRALYAAKGQGRDRLVVSSAATVRHHDGSNG
ncbi:MAG: diguanylate cyclase [Spongiibacteraceae bacterium]|jgi:diguanylate cyclase (GGDEF)-like protein|nr:diguanylate cyclase [Spongiibacteraceae bacterium]